jgi:hypothetical protein
VGGLERNIVSPDGGVLSIACDSHTLTTDEFAAFIDRCAEWIQMHRGYLAGLSSA